MFYKFKLSRLYSSMPRQRRTRNAKPLRAVRVRNSRLRNRQGTSFAPPPWKGQPIRNMKLRYQSTMALAVQNFTVTQLGGMVGVIATTTTAASSLCQNFRIRRIKIWSPVITNGTIVTNAIDWNSGSSSPSGSGTAISDSAMSQNYPAHVSSAPPKGSKADLWQSVINTDNIVAITCPIGSILDFDFEFSLSDQAGPLQAYTVVAATAGEIYHLITNNLSCVYLNTI
jgi:hypothetical protein